MLYKNETNEVIRIREKPDNSRYIIWNRVYPGKTIDIYDSELAKRKGLSPVEEKVEEPKIEVEKSAIQDTEVETKKIKLPKKKSKKRKTKK
jgi:hypothetical protein